MAPVPLDISPIWHSLYSSGVHSLLVGVDMVKEINKTLLPQPAQQQRPVQQFPRFQRTQPQPLNKTPEKKASIKPYQQRYHINPKNWSPFWQKLLQRTPAHPKVIWTYMDLSKDLVAGQAANSAHRKLLYKLLKDIPKPVGSHAFWPLNAYPRGKNDPEVDAKHFLEGINYLKPDTLILLTGKVPQGLGSDFDKIRPMVSTIIAGRAVFLMPSVDQLLTNEEYHMAISFLQSFLKNIG